MAIALTETGRQGNGQFAPWPWAMNSSGVGHYFNSKAALLKAAQAAKQNGKTSFDVGCFQINYRWHRTAFDSLEQMVSPVPNTRYAAAFLTRLFDEFGSWDKAVGAYHSRTEKHAIRYRKAVEKNLEMADLLVADFLEKPAPKPVETPETHKSKRVVQPLLAPRSNFGALFSDRKAFIEK